MQLYASHNKCLKGFSETEREAQRGRRLFQRAAQAEIADILFELNFAAQARLDEVAAKWPDRAL